MEFLKLLAKNWKLVLILFGLGGTVTVLSIVPGTDTVASLASSQVDAVKAKLVSATATVSATAQ